MKVYVVTAELNGESSVLAACSNMDEVVNQFGSSWSERFTVYEVEVDNDNLFPPKVGFYRGDTKEVITI